VSLRRPGAVAFALLLQGAWPGAAAADPRDDDIFGEEPASPPLSPDQVQGLLEEADDPMVVGGELWLQVGYFHLESGPAEESPLTSPNVLDLYLDARPADGVRAYFRGRLDHDLTAAEGSVDPFGEPRERTRTRVDQLLIQFNLAQRLFVTAGRQRVKWGSGRMWNPTDFLNRSTLNPIDTFDQRLGVGLVKLHFPLAPAGWSLYAISELEGADRPDRLGGALRLEMLMGQTELAFMTESRGGEKPRYGADVSTGIWLLDLRAEGALLHDEEEAWKGQVVTGGDITFKIGDQDNLTLGGEWFHNQLGTDDVADYPLLILQGQFDPFYVGRDYAAAFILLPGPGSWNDTTLVLSGITNLSDESRSVRFDYRVRALGHIDAFLFANHFFGEDGSLHFFADWWVGGGMRMSM
jgi:hypothetical protein